MDIILLGAQASGKGTQAELLTHVFRIPHISSGDLFRKEIEKDTALGRKARGYIERGELVPDDLTVAIVLRRMQEPDCQHSVLLDGFPRTFAQARYLDRGMAERGRRIDAVVYLEVAREELYRRIASRFICKAHQHIYNIHSSPPQRAGICDLDGSELYQRSDDQGTTIQQRLDIFFAQTIHLLDYYGAQENILKIDGGQAVENVHRAIIAGLSKLALGRGIGRRREIVGNVNGPL